MESLELHYIIDYVFEHYIECDLSDEQRRKVIIAHEEIKNIIEQRKELKINEYKYECQKCNNFHRFLQRTCPICKTQNFYTGSFKQSDLEEWLKTRNEI